MFCISSCIDPASKISPTTLPSLHFTKLAALVWGSSIAHLILLYSSRCSSCLMASLISVHLMGLFRSEASLYLSRECSHHSWQACISCSLMSLWHADVPTAHSAVVSVCRLMIPVHAATWSTLPPKDLSPLCHTTMFTYALHLKSIYYTCGLKSKSGLIIFLHLLSPPCWMLLLCASMCSSRFW